MFEMWKINADESKVRALLRATEITAEVPGSILSDVAAMLDFIGADGIATKSKNGNLPTEVLDDLNQRLSDPVELVLKRPLLRHYPNLAGIYLLLRTMELIAVRNKRIEIEASAWERWQGMIPVEQYFTLLETWFFYADAGMLDAGNEMRVAPWRESFEFFRDLPRSTWKTYPDFVHNYPRPGYISDWGAQMQMRFGLIRARPATVGSASGRNGRGWHLHKAKRTEWGTALMWAFAVWMNTQPAERFYFNTEAPFEYGDLKSALGRYFSQWIQSWTEPEVELRPGTYRFVVTLRTGEPHLSPQRVFRVPGTCTFDELGCAILESVNFDDDHGFEFRYRDWRGITHVYMSPWMDEGPFADEITFEFAEIPNTGTMRFLFDFGDRWEFNLKLLSVDAEDPALKKPQLVESKGKAPEQYPSWDG